MLSMFETVGFKDIEIIYLNKYPQFNITNNKIKELRYREDLFLIKGVKKC